MYPFSNLTFLYSLNPFSHHFDRIVPSQNFRITEIIIVLSVDISVVVRGRLLQARDNVIVGDVLASSAVLCYLMSVSGHRVGLVITVTWEIPGLVRSD